MKFTLSLAAMVLATFATFANAADGLIEVKSPHSAGACPVVENLRKALAGIAEAAVAK